MGVGHIVRATASSKFPLYPSGRVVFSVMIAAIALKLRGVGHIFTFSAKPNVFRLSCFSMSLLGLVSFSVGVGHNPDPIASVRGIDGASWNNKWRGLIPEAFQVRKAALEAQRFVNKASHIFPNDPSRP